MIKPIHGSHLLISGLILFLISCTPNSCFEETESYLKVSFHNKTTGLIQAPDSITIYGLNMENSKLDTVPGLTPAKLPLNASTPNCTYIIRINGVSDTVEFTYTSTPYLVSKECGYSFHHNLDTAPPTFTKHIIENIYIANRTITTANVENLRIFY